MFISIWDCVGLLLFKCFVEAKKATPFWGANSKNAYAC